jgi:hypothetical protein
MAKKVKKYQGKTGSSSVTPTKDSTAYYKADKDLYYKQAATNAEYGLKKEADEMMKKAAKAAQNEARQKNKGRYGYDANGYSTTPKTKSQPDPSKSDWYNVATRLSNKRAGGPVTAKKYANGGGIGDTSIRRMRINNLNDRTDKIAVKQMTEMRSSSPNQNKVNRLNDKYNRLEDRQMRLIDKDIKKDRIKGTSVMKKGGQTKKKK